MFDSLIDALLDPAVAFSGFAILILTGLSKLNLISILAQTSLEEQNLMTRSTKWYRKNLINLSVILFGCVYFLYLLSADVSGFSLYKFMYELSRDGVTVYLVLLCLSLMYLVLILVPSIQKWITKVVYKNPYVKRKKAIFTLSSLFFMLIYILTVLPLYAFNVILYLESNAEKLKVTIDSRLELFVETSLYDPKTIIDLILLTFICYSLLAILPLGYKFLGYSESLAHITLKDGSIIKDVYIFNPNLKNGIMISYSNSSFSKTFIPSDNINRIDFTTSTYFLGKKQISAQNDIITDLTSLSTEDRNIVNGIVRKPKFRKYF